MAAPVIQFKRGVLADLPALRAGEPGFTTDAYDLYVGVNSTTGTNQFVGSGRYWQVNSATVGSGVKLVEGSNNGAHAITIKSPNSLAGDLTYTMPGTDGSNGQYLQTNGSGELSFSTVDSSFTLAADSGSNDTFTTGETLTFTGTANEVETAVSNNEITFSLPATINANTSGNAATSDQVKVIKNETSGNYYFTFVDSNNTSAAYESLYTDTALNLNPSTNIVSGGGMDMVSYFINSVQITSTATELNVLDGIPSTLTATELGYVDGVTSAIQTQLDAKGTLTNQNALITLSGVSAAAENLGTFTGSTISDNGTIKAVLQEVETSLETVTGGNAASATVATAATTTNANHFLTFVDANNTAKTQEAFHTDAGIYYNPFTNQFNANGVNAGVLSLNGVDVTSTAAELNVLDGIASLDTDLSSVSSNDDTLASAKAIKTYIDSQVTAQDLDLAADSGTGAVDLDSQSLTIAGTANEVETSVSGQTVTVGLPAAVVVTTSLDVPTVEATNLKAKDGTTSITITDSTGAVACAHNLTVGGNLIVNGSTTQVNTTNTTVDDALFEIGTVSGSAPSSDLNKDIGLVMHYFSSSAKKAAVYWDDSAGRIILSKDVSESANVLTNNAGAEIEVSGLHITGCSGTQEIISCSSGEVVITNATIDGGSF